jgi:hypothetical protein
MLYSGTKITWPVKKRYVSHMLRNETDSAAGQNCLQSYFPTVVYKLLAP